MKILITGGCKNGKSTFALKIANLLAAENSKYYIATMLPCDAHELECVRNHREARAEMNYTTLEYPHNIAAHLTESNLGGTFLLDSVTALLANEMFLSDGEILLDAPRQVAADLDLFLARVEHAVIVSDYICADGGAYSHETEAYRDGLSFLERHLAARCDCVVEVCAGIPIVQKGILPNT